MVTREEFETLKVIVAAIDGALGGLELLVEDVLLVMEHDNEELKGRLQRVRASLSGVVLASFRETMKVVRKEDGSRTVIRTRKLHRSDVEGEIDP